jgi:hypothetical protein
LVLFSHCATGTIYIKKETQLLTFADDIYIIGRSLEAVRNVYLALEVVAANIGLFKKKTFKKYFSKFEKNYNLHFFFATLHNTKILIIDHYIHLIKLD